MKKYKKVLKEEIEDVICDICSKSCKDYMDNIEIASLIAHWGYSSKKDTQQFEVHLCENCFDKTLEFLSKLKGSSIDPIAEGII